LKSHHAVPRFLETVAERHRAGINAGRTPVKHLVEQAIALVNQHDEPAIQHYRDVLVNGVLPYGRDEEHAGLCWLPDGEALYRKAIRTHTTADLDPHELHAALDGSRPGTYFINTKEPHTRLRSVAEATAFHEAVPGHHFESTRLGQLQDLPLLRRKAPIGVFSEGWAFYCERLADEMGLYSTEEARFGWSRPKSTATSPNQPRRWRTWWAASSSTNCARSPTRQAETSATSTRSC
jgi:uncharacterized protein (DUF885 family)